MSDSRERFEAWCGVEGINIERQASGVYAYAPARVAWRSWQAAERDALELAAKVCDTFAFGYGKDYDANRSDTYGGEKCESASDCADAIRALAGKE